MLTSRILPHPMPMPRTLLFPALTPERAFDRAQQLGSTIAAELFAEDVEPGRQILSPDDYYRLAREAGHYGETALLTIGRRYCPRCGGWLRSSRERREERCLACRLEVMAHVAMARDPDFPDVDETEVLS